MVPKALLPEAIFAAIVAQNWSARSDNASRKASFDPSPPIGKIRVAGRQCQDCMQMVWEDHDGIGNKRPFALRRLEGRT